MLGDGPAPETIFRHAATNKHLAIRLLLTAPQDPATEALVQTLNDTGASVEWLPLIHIELMSPSVLPDSHPDWLFFTSKNGVRGYFQNQTLRSHHPTPRIAVIGTATAQALKAFGYKATFIASVFNAADAAAEFLRIYPEAIGQTVLWPCGNQALPTLADCLRAAQVTVMPLIVYRTILKTEWLPAEMERLRTPWTVVIFTSPSAVNVYFEALARSGFAATTPLYASFGGATLNAIRQHQPDATLLIAPHNTFEAIGEMLCQWIAPENGDC